MQNKKDIIFQKINSLFQKTEEKDFNVFLNKTFSFEGRDWTYGQFLYKYHFDRVAEFTYRHREKPKNDLEEKELNLVKKGLIIMGKTDLWKPDSVTTKPKQVKDMGVVLFSGDVDKRNTYQELFASTKRSTEGNPCYWHPVAQYQFLVIEHKLSQMGMSPEQVHALMVHCETKREEAEKNYKKKMPSVLIHNSPRSEKEMGKTIQARLRYVDSWINTQKYCFVAEPGVFHSGLPIQGENEFISWSKFRPKVLAFLMSEDEFKEKTKNGSYNYTIDMSQKDTIQPCIPMWGGPPFEWISTKDLKYTDVKKETLADLIDQGMQFYLVPQKEDWKTLLREKGSVSEKEAKKYLENLCKDGRASRFSISPSTCPILKGLKDKKGER